MANDFIDEAQQEAQLRFGKELSPQELADQFLLHDLDARTYHLKNLKADNEMTLDQAARRYEYETLLRNTHETLRKIGR